MSLRGDLLPGLAAAHAFRRLGHDVRAASGAFVNSLDQQPSAVIGEGESETTAELDAAHDEREVIDVVPDEFDLALVPNDHRAGASRRVYVDALKVTRRKLVVINLHSEPGYRRIK